MRPGYLAAVLASAVQVFPASATQTLRDEREILVIGETLKQAEKKARAYIREVGIAVGDRPTARWFEKICPKALGLDDSTKARVEQEFRAIIRRVNAPIAKAKCRPNLLLAFTADPRGVVKEVMRKSIALRQVKVDKVRFLADSDAPIRWWYMSGVRNRDGQTGGGALNPALLRAFDKPVGQDVGEPVSIPTGDEGYLPVTNGSNISTQAMRTIDGATVVIDGTIARKYPLSAIVDYAAIVSLAEIKLGAAPEGSVLGMFEPNAVRMGMTTRDVTMLTGLYKIQLDRKAEQQRRTLVNAMVKQIARERKSEEQSGRAN